jgi:malate dehydrogenase
MRLAQQGLGEIALIDVAQGLAKGKACDLQDAQAILKSNYSVLGSDDLSASAGSDIVVVTAGFARRPGMSREELRLKNSAIVKEICLGIKEISPSAIAIIVTNPLDLMTRLAISTLGFPACRVIGMGVSLDAARFANLISEELRCPASDVEAVVIGSHGEGMLPLPRFCKVKGECLEKALDAAVIKRLVERTINRGAEIVSYLGSGSAFFAPSAAAAELVAAVAKDEKRLIGVSCLLSGEYGISGACLGVPCRIGRGGIEEVIQLELNAEEKAALSRSAESLRNASL